MTEVLSPRGRNAHGHASVLVHHFRRVGYGKARIRVVVGIILLFVLWSNPSTVSFAQPVADGMVLNAASLNGQTVNPTVPEITLQPGEALSGTVNFTVENSHPSNALFPVVLVWSWGQHQTSYAPLLGSAPGDAATPLILTLNEFPTTGQPGTYYLIIVAAAETTAAHVASATRWYAGDPIWNNGDDVASWSEDQIDFTIANGFLVAPSLPEESSRFAAAAIKILVPQSPAVPAVSPFGLIALGVGLAALLVWASRRGLEFRKKRLGADTA